MATNEILRRDFLGVAGPGLFVFFHTGPLEALQEPERLPARMAYPTDFNAYLRVNADGRVGCFVGKVELGQGAMTSLAQLLAEELDVALDSVDMTMGDTDLCPWDVGTFGSLNIWQFGPVLRAAGAEARAVLVQMAAEQLQAPADRLQVRAGVVIDPASAGKSVTYAQLVQGKRIERHLPKVAVKPVKSFRVIGQSPRRKDALEKVTGRAKYAGDIVPPGALHARILRPPAHGATLKDVDTSAAEKVPGVQVVRDGDLVAVLHERRDVADKALALLKAQFVRPQPSVDDKTIFAHLLKTAPQPRLVSEGGSLTEGEKLAAAVFDETYLNSYVSHATIETHSAVATIENGKATVWASTQAPFSVKPAVARALGFPQENVRIITPYVGGGFGGKSGAPQAVEAARLAKLTGKPVRVVWDRAEEFFYDTFRPAAVIRIRSGLNSAGKIVFWDYRVVGAGDRNSEQFYNVAHHRTTSAGGWQGGNPPGMHPFAVGPWRAPSVNSNTFGRESHIDVMAARAGVDPVEFRRSNLTDARMLRVLDAAAKQFGWKPAKAPSGRGVGVACAIYAGTYVATMAELSVDKKTGRVQVRRVVCAMDEGVVVSPDGTRQQMEGSITMGLGYALTEEARFKDGEVLDKNFDTYELPRFSWLPRIETVLINNPDLAAQSCGEPPIVTMGAVVASAIYDVAGIRLFQ
ncbi:MAG TPA: molybdopterin cofactor-binding domain-containing protein, partial [Bryobacteraceae bacterium]|nr:molybdopterin cofactor-binding domain-containing protein [Bryobacteraceae bacterium]